MPEIGRGEPLCQLELSLLDMCSLCSVSNTSECERSVNSIDSVSILLGDYMQLAEEPSFHPPLESGFR